MGECVVAEKFNACFSGQLPHTVSIPRREFIILVGSDLLPEIEHKNCSLGIEDPKLWKLRMFAHCVWVLTDPYFYLSPELFASSRYRTETVSSVVRFRGNSLTASILPFLTSRFRMKNWDDAIADKILKYGEPGVVRESG